ASPYAGRRWPLRRIFRKKLAAADLPDGEKQCSSERLSSFCLSPECSENRAHPLGAHVLRWGRVALIGEPRFTIDEGSRHDLARPIVEATLFAAPFLVGFDHDGRHAV